MKSFLLGISLILMALYFSACKLPKSCDETYKRKDLIGKYSRNTAAGWSRPRPGIEIIPDIPNYQYLAIKKFNRFSFQPYQDTAIYWNGKWKVVEDTLQLVYENSGTINKYLIKKNGGHFTLLPINSKKRSFSRVNNYGDEKPMKNRVQWSTLCYNDGTIKRSGKVKKFADGDRKRPRFKKHGKWRYYHEDGTIEKVEFYRRGKLLREKSFVEQ